MRTSGTVARNLDPFRAFGCKKAAVQPALDHVLNKDKKVIFPVAGASLKLLLYSGSNGHHGTTHSTLLTLANAKVHLLVDLVLFFCFVFFYFDELGKTKQLATKVVVCPHTKYKHTFTCSSKERKKNTISVALGLITRKGSISPFQVVIFNQTNTP